MTVLSAALGALVGRRELTGVTLALGATIGGLCGAILASLEVFLTTPAGAALRRLPLLVVLVLRTAAYGIVFVAAIHGAGALFRWLGAALPPDAGTATQSTLLISAGIALGINLVMLMRAMLGGRTLLWLLVGYYSRPRAERHVVLFLDLQGSTALAERIGDTAFHGFLNRVAYDVTDPILASGGTIYRYVGDEIIVTWPFARGVRDAACIAAVFAVNDALARRRGEYERVFGAAARLRAALHAGPLVVGEMGDVKREIVMLGDVMNATARIAEQGRATGEDVIASSAVIAGLALPRGVVARSLGTAALRGKAEAVELFALARAPDPGAPGGAA